jgi:hypothetical protein
MEKIRVLEIAAREEMRTAGGDKSRKASVMSKVVRMPSVPNRESRAEALLRGEEQHPLPGFKLQKPPRRYLVIESDDSGTQLEAHQSDSLPEIAKLLESSNCNADITEIHDLDTGDILKPDFERVYRVPRIYRRNIIAYQSPSDNR